jgi:hypothetical protein
MAVILMGLLGRERWGIGIPPIYGMYTMTVVK